METMPNPVLSVIVPCYNEEEVIEVTHRRLSGVLEAMGIGFEILYIDDGCRDATPRLLAGIAAGDARVRVVRLARNFGHQIAVSAGLHYAAGDAVVLIDADLQDPPEVIQAFMERWREGYHVVYGQRMERPGETPFKLWTARAFYRLINRLSEVPIPLDSGDFRLLDRAVVDALLRMPERHRLLRAMTSWVGFRQIPVPYSRAERFAGTSKYPLRKMLALALDGIVSFSTVPLRLVSLMGLAMSGAAVVGFLYAVAMRLFTSVWVPGWTLLFGALMLIAGMLFICLGIIGEYVGRIYSEVKARPLFLVQELIGFQPPATGRAGQKAADPATLAPVGG